MNAFARTLASRALQALMMAWLVASLCFAFVHMLPGDNALSIAMARVAADRVTPELVDRVRRDEGLDAPLPFQYGQWLGRLAQGDLGISLVSRKKVAEELTFHAGYTLQLGLIGWLLSYVLALPLGLAAGWKPGGLIDRTTSALAILLASTPTFLLGIGLIALFALTLRWLPPAGFRTPAHMALPALTLALGLAAFSVRVIRNAVADVRAQFYMTFARMRGYGAGAAFIRHGLRSAAIPVVTLAALQFGYVVDGFVIIETLFNYPGLGQLLVKSLLARDIPVIMGASLVIGLTFALASLVADLACLGLDPRQRAAGLS